jgi:hypothetical protein
VPMTYINPLANALPQSFAAQHHLSADKSRLLREQIVPPRTVPERTDQFEHQIESPEEAAPTHEEARQKRQSRGRRQRHAEDEATREDEKSEHIDLRG